MTLYFKPDALELALGTRLPLRTAQIANYPAGQHAPAWSRQIARCNIRPPHVRVAIMPKCDLLMLGRNCCFGRKKCEQT